MKPVYSLIKKIVKQDSLECFIVSTRPIILMSYWHDFYYKHHKEILKALPKKKNCYMIFQVGYYKSKIAILEVKEQLDKIQEMNENVNYIFLANSEEEYNNFNKFGLVSVYCNQNCFLDEEHYKVLPKSPKKYDAIYIARMTPVKRHLLAKNIKNLLLLGSYYKKEIEHVNKVKEGLKHAKWIEKVPHANISKYINQADVGLALSDVEGAMFVSTEYLLCGLPQVSTPSVGGRDVYFNDDYVRIVKPDPDEVLAGVEELKKQKFDPMKIRYETIKIMKSHRDTFIDLIQSIYKREGKRRKFEREWNDIFTHKMALRMFAPPKVYKERILKPNMKL